MGWVCWEESRCCWAGWQGMLTHVVSEHDQGAKLSRCCAWTAQAVAEAAALRARVEGAGRDAAALAAAKARLVAAERAQRATEWELEVCRQRLEQVRAGCCWMRWLGGCLDGSAADLAGAGLLPTLTVPTHPPANARLSGSVVRCSTALTTRCWRRSSARQCGRR